MQYLSSTRVRAYTCELLSTVCSGCESVLHLSFLQSVAVNRLIIYYSMIIDCWPARKKLHDLKKKYEYEYEEKPISKEKSKKADIFGAAWYV